MPAPPRGSGVIDVTEQTFQTDVLERSMEVPVCCRPVGHLVSTVQAALARLLERLAEQGRGTWILAKVDIDANPRIAQAFGVQSIPTVIALRPAGSRWRRSAARSQSRRSGSGSRL